MLRAFPDYGKSPPEYVASIVNLLAEYPAHIQERLADIRFGIPSKTDFLPTPKIITEFAEKHLQAEREATDHAKRFAGRVPIQGVSAPFRPFPQLWAEFGDEFMDSKTRDKKISFDSLDAACKALVLQGRDAALHALKNTKGAPWQN